MQPSLGCPYRWSASDKSPREAKEDREKMFADFVSVPQQSRKQMGRGKVSLSSLRSSEGSTWDTEREHLDKEKDMQDRMQRPTILLENMFMLHPQ